MTSSILFYLTSFQMGVMGHGWKERVAKMIFLVSVTVGEAGVETRAGFLVANITQGSQESSALRPVTHAEVSIIFAISDQS